MATTVKATKKPTTGAAAKKPRSYPPYSEMINEAITSLKERTGSSQIAIAKFIEEKQKANLPINFKKLLLVQLKKLVVNGKLVKVKSSFKLAPKTSSAVRKPKSTSAAAKKPKSASAKTIAKKIKSVSTKTATKKPKSTTTAAAKKPKSTTTAAKKVKPASTKVKKPVAAKLGKSPAKKAAVAPKAKKPKTIKTPVKKVAAKK